MCEERHTRTWETLSVPVLCKVGGRHRKKYQKGTGKPTQPTEGRLMADRESDQPIVLRDRESRLHWLIPDGEGVDSHT